MKKRIFLTNKDEIITILGEQDKNIPVLEKRYGVEIVCYENDKFVIEIKGQKRRVIQTYSRLLDSVRNSIPKDITSSSVDNLSTDQQPTRLSNKVNHAPHPEGQSIARHGVKGETVYVTYTGRLIRPLSRNQTNYVNSIDNNDIVISIGPAGTGKTFLAVAKALAKLDNGEVNRIVLTRPVVESGERLGFLPGDLLEKINPYLRPLYDAFYTMLGTEKFRRYRDDEIIEIVPLAYMRGRTLEDAFIILDEAQNTVPEQMKMFLTRLGFNSQTVITGDITQIDLEKKNLSGLVLIKEILQGIKGIKFVYFTEKDVVRHKLVKEIIKAYEIWERKK